MPSPDVKTQILLVRHGQTPWNQERRLQGATDIPLNELGRQQAEVLRQSLCSVSIDRVYSSPLSRAQETARIIAEGYNVPVEIEPGLRERSYGTYEGQHTSVFDEVRQILKRLSPEERSRYRHADEETEEDVMGRFLPALKRMAVRSVGQNVLAVSHGSAMGMLLRTQFGGGGMKSPYLTNTAVLHIESDGNSFVLKDMRGVEDKYA